MPESLNDPRAQRILDATIELVVHYGYDKTTVSDIAEKAGVSKGAIYLHWPSKDDLFEALIWRETWRYVDDWLARIENDPDGGTLVGLFKNALLTMTDKPFIQAMMIKDRRILGDFMRRKGSEIVSQGYGMSKEFIAMMQAAGALRQDLDPEVAAYVMNSIRYSILTMDQVLLSGQTPPMDKVIEMTAAMLDRFLTPEDGGNREAGKQIIKGLIEAFRQQQQAAAKK